MSKRIAAHEKFWWRGWEFRQSMATSKEVQWVASDMPTCQIAGRSDQPILGKLQIRVIYRDIQDPDSPPEYTALIHLHGLASGEGTHTAGAGCGANLKLALAAAERDFESKLVVAGKLLSELRRGKQPDP